MITPCTLLYLLQEIRVRERALKELESTLRSEPMSVQEVDRLSANIRDRA
jgi:hypothetical protein